MQDKQEVGARVRRNGTTYYPRDLSGYEDLWFYQKARKLSHHILLAGPPGSGKTAGVEAAFDSVPEGESFPQDKPLGLHTIVCSDSTTVDDFVGSYVQNPTTKAFEWVHGPLIRSILDDVPLLVDECGLLDPKVASILYPLMDGRGYIEVTQNPSLPPFRVGDGWFVVAAYNPDVPGANMSEAFLDRFAHVIEVESDWELAAQIGVSRKLIIACKMLNMSRRDGEISWSPQFRSLMSFKENMEQFGLSFAIKDLIGKTPSEDREHVKGILAKVGLGTSDEDYTALQMGGRR